MTRAGPSVSIAFGTAWKECTPRVATLSLCLRPHVVDLLHSAVFQEAATNLTFPKKPSKQIEFPNRMGVCLFLPGPRLWFPPCMSCLWTHSYYNLCSVIFFSYLSHIDAHIDDDDVFSFHCVHSTHRYNTPTLSLAQPSMCAFVTHVQDETLDTQRTPLEMINYSLSPEVTQR